MCASKYNLPAQATSFVGRETEVAEILSLLDDEHCRLLTLVGPGGIGKTRLAVRVAEKLAQPESGSAPISYTDGVVFVPLQSVSSPDQVASTIANTLAWETYQGNDPEAELLAYLRNKRLLLILDNFEHLTGAAPLVREMLDGAPQVKLLVTSRAVLNLAEEWLFHVDGMSLSTDKDKGGTAGSDAVQLFRERAQRVRRDFSLDRERAQVVRICRLVEGMPLAIELASAWLRRLPCAEIISELERGLGVLTSDQLGVLERHRTMRVVFDHSWRLLNRDEQAVLMALSVFRGGFLREAAEDVAGATLPILSSLVDKSLLSVTSSGRYAIHELQRQYAAERLAEAPALQAKVCDEHSTYYLKFVARPAIQYLAPGNRELLAEIEAEIDNILAAWYWAAEQRRLSDLRGATEALYWFSWLSTYHMEGERAFRHAAGVLRNEQVSDEQQTVYAYVLASHGSMCIWLGHIQRATEELQESAAILRGLTGARREMAFAVGALAWSLYSSSEIGKAKALFLEAVELDQETEQFEQQAFIYCMLGDVARSQSTYQEQEQWYQEALHLGRKIGDQRTIADALSSIARFATEQGEYAKARRYLEESLSVARSHDLSAFVISALRILGQLAEITGDLHTASKYVEQSLDTARLWGNDPSVTLSLVALAQIRTAQGRHKTAANLLREAADILAEFPRLEHQIALLAGMGALALHTGEHTSARLHYEECLVLSRQSGDRLSTVQALVGAGLVAIRQGDSASAVGYVLDALREGLSTGLTPVLLDTVTAAAELLATEGDLTYAAQLAVLARNHAANTAETKKRANTLLSQVDPKLPPDICERILNNDAEVDIEAVAKRLVAELTRLSETPAPAAAEQPLIEPLSDRELQVLRMVAAGKSNREIGRELYLALGTVKSHLHHIFQKLDVRSRTQAVARAIDLKLL